MHRLAQLERLNYLDLSVQKEEGWRSLASLKNLNHLETVWIGLKPDEYDEMLPGVDVERAHTRAALSFEQSDDVAAHFASITGSFSLFAHTFLLTFIGCTGNSA